MLFFAYMVHSELNLTQKLYSSEKHNKDGVINYGYALRYGKFAVISVVMNYFEEPLSSLEYKGKAEYFTKRILKEWPNFENFIIEQRHNKDYFRETINPDTKEVRLAIDFDGYYKGRTINGDLLLYFIDFKLQNDIL